MFVALSFATTAVDSTTAFDATKPYVGGVAKLRNSSKALSSALKIKSEGRKLNQMNSAAISDIMDKCDHIDFSEFGNMPWDDPAAWDENTPFVKMCLSESCADAFKNSEFCPAECKVVIQKQCPVFQKCGAKTFQKVAAANGACPLDGSTVTKSCKAAGEIAAFGTRITLTIDESCLVDDPSSDPCFSRSATACRLVGSSISPAAAFTACFDQADLSVAERVPMADLRSGDLVLSEAGAASRVVVTQHVASAGASSMVLLDYGVGSLELTPDHVIKADGAFVAAREVAVGSMLGEHKVKHVLRTYAGVINPITVAGTILAAGKEGAPVVASTYPEWISGYMLSSALPLPLSASNLLSYLFPATAQAFYDGLVEPLFPATGGLYRSYLEAVPAPAVPVAFVAGDAAVSAAFSIFALGPIGMAAAVLLVAASVRRTKA